MLLLLLVSVAQHVMAFVKSGNKGRLQWRRHVNFKARVYRNVVVTSKHVLAVVLASKHVLALDIFCFNETVWHIYCDRAFTIAVGSSCLVQTLGRSRRYFWNNAF